MEHFTLFLQWFNDVFSTDISEKSEDILELLMKTHGCEVSPFLLFFRANSCTRWLTYFVYFILKCARL